MEIRRVTNPEIIKFLYPFFIEDGAYTRDIIAKELFEIMVSVPDEVFVAVIFEENEIMGFGIAWIQDNREYIYLSQAWSKPGCNRNYGKKAINVIEQWAIKEYNIHEMRFETKRNPEAIERAWGFKLHSTTMRSNF